MPFLPGLKGMLNYHPLFVHFPIAFWLGALLFEALAVWRSSEEWHRTAAGLLYLGTLSAFAAAGTGLLAEEAVMEMGPERDVFEIHEKMMFVTTSLAVGLCMFVFFLRKRFTPALRKLLLVGLVALAILLTLGSDRGAQLVYQYATAVHLPGPPK
ncbi:MAG TPA: DUF2231 domain-containing protein [Candidatus Acidoferrales bacterium]|jgi:uncharacterized membrane protein|nr:DUF2231 domain-containing protein [Candidatus Acidoferrales bacterium]